MSDNRTRLKVIHRALPLAWHVVRGSRGHFRQADHVSLIRQIAPLIAKATEVVFLGRKWVLLQIRAFFRV